MSESHSASAGSGTTLDVAKFLQGLPFTPFHRRILILSCLVTFFDGLDFSLISYTLPYIRDEMSLTAEVMGNVSMAAFIGQMIGSLFGSYLADVIGRRPVILICTVLSALLTFVTGFAQTPEMLFILRLIGGLAIGGLLAPAWSLNIEAMPAGRRATAVTIVMLGFSAGAAAAGPITNLLAPHLGWHYVFFVCGALTLALALILQFTLPESARWLVAKGKSKAKVSPLLASFDPTYDAARHDSYFLSDETFASKDSPIAKFRELFRGWLSYITPLIWVAYFFSSFAIYLKSSFGVLFLEELGLSVVNATWIGSITGIVGAITGVFLLSMTEKRGPALITLAPLLGIPFLLLVGFGVTLYGHPAFIPVIFIGGILVGAGHAGVISITSIYYPSAIRSTGGGWASFMAKFAAVAAPWVGSRYFLGSEDAVLAGYTFSAICLGGIIVCVLALARFAKRLQADQAREELARDAQPAPAE